MKPKYLRHITAFLTCYMLCVSAYAVPIRPRPGIHIPEYLMPTDRDNPALWTRQPDYLFNRVPAAPGEYSVSDIPRTGEIEYPLVLVEFQDLHFFEKDTAVLRRHFERLFNEHGYPDTARIRYKDYVFHPANGSVSDYFFDQSYGKFKPTFEIIGPITLSKGFAYYGRNNEYGYDDKMYNLIKEVLDSIITGNLTNISGYARNGVIDQISIIYAGKGENSGDNDPNYIWPHANLFYFNNRTDALIYGKGIRQVKYACSQELYMDTDSIYDGIGTFCHEFSHTLGLPDYYNTADSQNDTYSPMGYWSVMDMGCYEESGFAPVGYTAFEKYSLGWLELEEITGPGTLTLNDISQEPHPESGIHTAYRLSTADDNQFLIIENHNKTGWYSHHRARGLLVTAVDYKRSSWQSNQLNAGLAKGYHLLPADNNYEPLSNAGDLYPYQWVDSLGVTHVIDSITTKGTPELKAGTSFPLYSIYNITRKHNQVSFTVKYDLPTEIVNTPRQEISIDVSDGNLKVSAPTGSRILVYDISGKPVSETTATAPVQQISLPGHGIWIVKCGNITRKVRL